MELLGNIIIYIIMACAVAGALAAIKDEESPLGSKFLEGINSIGPLFLPIAGILAAAPILTQVIASTLGPLFSLFGTDQAMAATTFIAVDMGGYQLAEALASTKEGWIMAMTTGYMAGATIVFNIPVALKMIKKENHKYLALGMMSGFIAIPIGVFVSSLMIYLTNPIIRDTVATSGDATYVLSLTMTQILINLIPLIIICGLLAFFLLRFEKGAIKGFQIFATAVDVFIKLVFVLCVVEFFTGIFTNLFNVWPFDPIIADEIDPNRALETAGYIGMMLCGAFPMVYLVQKYFSKPLEKLGQLFGLSKDATTGLVACAANALALFAIIDEMKPKDMIITLAFTVCGAFVIGDHLAYTVNYQPNLILPISIGKLAGGIFAIIVALKLIIPRLNKTEKVD